MGLFGKSPEKNPKEQVIISVDPSKLIFLLILDEKPDTGTRMDSQITKRRLSVRQAG